MPLINGLLTRLLGPYWKYEALTFTYGPSLYKKDQVPYFLVHTE